MRVTSLRMPYSSSLVCRVASALIFASVSSTTPDALPSDAALVLAVLSASGAAKLSCSPGAAVVASPPYRVHSPSGCAGSADRILNLSERVSQLLPACTA